MPLMSTCLVSCPQIHEGMPGDFFPMGSHLDMHGGAKNSVELFAPKFCRCNAKGCDKDVRFAQEMEAARAAAVNFTMVVEAVMPTEYARQAALKENLLRAPYGESREILEKIQMADQHGLCQSMGNKTAASHGDNNNLNQFNYLHFSAPERIQELLKTSPKMELGVWAAEDGELFVRLRPRLELMFNSARSHQCLPSYHLIHWACNPQQLKINACKFRDECLAATRIYLTAHPQLVLPFQELEDAVTYQSSLIGTTTYQQRAVVQQLLNAAKAGTQATVLRGFRPSSGCTIAAANATIAACRSSPRLSGSGDGAGDTGSGDGRASPPELMPEESLGRQRALVAREVDRHSRNVTARGTRIRVLWDIDGWHSGEVVGVLQTLDPKDFKTSVLYDGEEKPVNENLHFVTWMMEEAE